MRRKQILPLQKHTYFSATPYTPTHARTKLQAAPLPLPASSFQPGKSLLFSLFSVQIQCLVSMDFCVSSPKDIHWNGHIYGMTNVLKAGGAIIVIQKPPIFGALCCHPVRLYFALPCYHTNFSALLLGCSSCRAVCGGLIEGHLCSLQW